MLAHLAVVVLGRASPHEEQKLTTQLGIVRVCLLLIIGFGLGRRQDYLGVRVCVRVRSMLGFVFIITPTFFSFS